MTFYDDDLARTHDEGFTDFVARAGIVELLHECSIDAGYVLDLGCGSGVLARQLFDAGFEVTGIDASRAMIEIARRRAPGATFVNASFHDVELPACRAVVSIGECFNYLNAAPDDPASLEALIRRIHGALERRGVLIFDVALPGRAGHGTRQTNRVTEAWAVLSESTEQEGTLTRRITTFMRGADGTFRRSDEIHRLRLIPPETLMAMLDACGFDARLLRAYPGVTFPDAYGAFVALKR
jgi:SAM-dependent methyltransferase